MTQQQQRRPPSPEVDFGSIGDNNPITIKVKVDQNKEPRAATHNKADSGGNLYVRYLVEYQGITHSLVCGENHYYRPDNDLVSRCMYQDRAEYILIERVQNPDQDFFWAVEEASGDALPEAPTGASASTAATPSQARTTERPSSPPGKASSAAPSQRAADGADLKVGDMPLQLADDIFRDCWNRAGGYVTVGTGGKPVEDEIKYKIAFTLFASCTTEGYYNRLPPDWEQAETQQEAPGAVSGPSTSMAPDEPPMQTEAPPEEDDSLPF